MQRRFSGGILLIVFLVCFAAGLLSVVVRGISHKNPAEDTVVLVPQSETGARTTSQSSDQMTALIVGVDNLDNSEPTLLAIWVATHQPPGNDIFLHGILINKQIGDEGQQPLNQVFEWSAESGIGPSFLSQLRQELQRDPDAIFVLDEYAFAALVDFAGGVILNGNWRTGAEVIDVLKLFYNDPVTSLSMQARVLEELSFQAPQLGDTFEVTPLVELIPDHAYSSMPITKAIMLLGRLLPFKQDNIHIDFSPE
jgi:hypothetical protein